MLRLFYFVVVVLFCFNSCDKNTDTTTPQTPPPIITGVYLGTYTIISDAPSGTMTVTEQNYYASVNTSDNITYTIEVFDDASLTNSQTTYTVNTSNNPLTSCTNYTILNSLNTGTNHYMEFSLTSCTDLFVKHSQHSPGGSYVNQFTGVKQ